MSDPKKTQDASKRQLNFYLDEADAFRLDKLCDRRGVSRTAFLAGLLAEVVAEVKLTAEDNMRINANIQKRIERGYPQYFKSPERYKR